MDKTGIQWTDATWNPVRGCSRVSAGCENCYAERVAHRFSGKGQPYEGLTVPGPKGPRWSGKVMLVEEALDQPLRWRKPRRIFVNSMSDLFHEDVPDAFIDRVFAVMALSPQHTFQVLTKRPERMREYFTEMCAEVPNRSAAVGLTALGITLEKYPSGTGKGCELIGDGELRKWPLPNVHLGVSCENQTAADERIPLLLQTPAAVRFVSAEPLLGAVVLAWQWIRPNTTRHMCADVDGMLRNKSFDALQTDDGFPMNPDEAKAELLNLRDRGVKVIPIGTRCETFSDDDGCPGHRSPLIDWIIVGGESGPGARPCDVEWIESIVSQCQGAKVPVFVKQLGAVIHAGECTLGDWGDGMRYGAAVDGTRTGQIHLLNKKGGDPSEWPESLRVRQFPKQEQNAG